MPGGGECGGNVVVVLVWQVVILDSGSLRTMHLTKPTDSIDASQMKTHASIRIKEKKNLTRRSTF